MVTKTDTLLIRLDVDGQGNVKASLANVEKEFERMDGSARRATDSTLSLGQAIQAVAGAAVVRGLVSTIVEFEKLEASLRTVSGAAAQADFSNLKQFATETPFQLQEVVGAFIKLKALGLDPSIEALRSYGNTASALGKSLNQFIEAVADAATGQFERLLDFGIRASKQGEEVQFTFQGVTETVRFSANAIEGYLRRIGQAQFAGAMTAEMETLGGAFSNLQDAAALFAASLGQAGLSDALKGAAGLLTELVGETDILTGAVVALSGAFTARLIPALYAAARAGTALAFLGGLPGIIAAAVSALGYLALRENDVDRAARAAKEAQEELNRVLGNSDDVSEAAARAAVRKADADLKAAEAALARAEAEARQQDAERRRRNEGALFSNTALPTETLARVDQIGIRKLRERVNGLRETLGQARVEFADFLSDSGGTGGGGSGGGGGKISKAQQKIENQIQGLIKSLEQEAATFGYTSEQVAIYRLQLLGATDAEIAQAQAAANAIAIRREEAEALKQYQQDLIDTEAKRLEIDRRQQEEAERSLTTLQQSLETEIEAERRHYEESIRIVEEGERRKLLTVQEAAELRARVETDHAERLKKIQQDASNEQTEFAKQAARNIQSALGDELYDIAQGNFENIGDAFANMLNRMMADLAAAELSKVLLGDYGKDGNTNVGGIIGSLFNAFVQHDGGMVGSGPARMVSPWLFAGAQRYHGGGYAGLKPGEVPIIAQRGERVLSREEVRAGVGSGQPGVSIINNITALDGRDVLERLSDADQDMALMNGAASARYNLRGGG